MVLLKTISPAETAPGEEKVHPEEPLVKYELDIIFCDCPNENVNKKISENSFFIIGCIIVNLVDFKYLIKLFRIAYKYFFRSIKKLYEYYIFLIKMI